uniref:G protein-coupled receptor 141 n=2 Tax=Callorhinchus milii TaxID=7868 RepID=A0A4W3JBD7_CALMI
MGDDSNSNGTSCDSIQVGSEVVLITLYSIVLLGGTVGAIIMTWKMKSVQKSVTSTAMVNLIFIHTLFLLTIPFRISYYALHEWKFGPMFCKLSSSMIHAHMYLAFVFYVIIVVIRMISFFKQKETVQFYQPWHASAGSLVIWFLVLLGVLPPFLLLYGKTFDYKAEKCFEFQAEMADPLVKVVNYFVVISVLMIIVALLTIQVGIIIKLLAQHAVRQQQQFGAQMKTIIFMLVMIVCFTPYLMFRLYYINKAANEKCLHIVNECFLALTAMSCFDVLTFLIPAH